ncbi:MAG TPA: L-glutamate gamma-semialdehyde dehydrogenase, partial [Planctomycetaceae bacterium]|nr:L-glutamate gamma-semialdehyde dehydrogenase [Planctomycetaceae bacterium]
MPPELRFRKHASGSTLSRSIDSAVDERAMHPWDDDFEPTVRRSVADRTQEIGRELFAQFRQERHRPWQRSWWDDRLMAWAMKDEWLKVELFRFVDVLPMLGTDREIASHLDEYLLSVPTGLPWWLRFALATARYNGLARRFLAWSARVGTSDFARRFIAGSNTQEVLAAARRERNAGRSFTLDILGEAVISEREADAYFQSYVELIENVSPEVNRWPEVAQVDQGVAGPLPRFNLSIKLSALDCHFDPIDPQGVLERAGSRFRNLLRIARKHRAFINVDMESYEKKDLTLSIFEQVLMEDEFRDVGDVGIVIQCYLHDAPRDLQRLARWSAERGKPVWVRLVKGAYWDYETVHARARGWPIPVFQRKWQSDVMFERATRFVLRNHDLLRPAIASHNVRSVAH